MIDITLNAQRTGSIQHRLTRKLQAVTEFPAVVSEPLDAAPLEWLGAQKSDAKFAWGDRNGEDLVVGLHIADKVTVPDFTGHSVDAREVDAREVVDSCRQILRGLPSQARMFGGFAFGDSATQRSGRPMSDREWSEFGRATFWLPRITVSDQQIHVLVRHATDVTRAVESVADLRAAGRASGDALPTWSRRVNLPERAEWISAVESAKQMFIDEVLEKIVLARRADLFFASKIDPVRLLERLMGRTPACYHFCFQAGGTGFVGATPERLFRREANRLASEVVAGTRPRGDTVDEDRRLGQTLLDSPKDQLEHDIVRKSICQRLHALVSRLEVDGRASLLRLASKQHLYSSVSAELLPNVHDGQLIERLHPTPAVGGYPTENAVAEIKRLEPFGRGWYAAPVGWISSDSIELAVAIRSALVNDHLLSLYSGAGIVPGSDAVAEWDEVEHKISDILQLFPSA